MGECQGETIRDENGQQTVNRCVLFYKGFALPPQSDLQVNNVTRQMIKNQGEYITGCNRAGKMNSGYLIQGMPYPDHPHQVESI